MAKINYSNDALEYIAKIADGGMRDAITLLDKCLSYSTELTLENVIKALGVADYEIMFELTESLLNRDNQGVLDIIESVHSTGKDLKLFIRTYLTFLLDVCKYDITKSLDYTSIPKIDNYIDKLTSYDSDDFDRIQDYLTMIMKLNVDIKWDSAPKTLIEATMLLANK